MYTDRNEYPPEHSLRGVDATLIREETAWRYSSLPEVSDESRSVFVAHWYDRREQARELVAPALRTHYTIEILLRSAVIECSRGDRRIRKGAVGFGGTQITAPGQSINCTFRRPVEAMHIFVPRSLVAATYKDIQKRDCPDSYELVDPAFSADAVMGKLACTLLEANRLRGPFAALYCESLAMAALARAMEFRADMSAECGIRTGLAPWRLRRTMEYIEDNLSEPITLNALAEHTGLSRMHFAAEFRRATGLSPHAFLMRQRLDMAKTMLIDDRLPIVQIAFAVGFRSQAHFTTAFRKATGITPGRWREQTSKGETVTSR